MCASCYPLLSALYATHPSISYFYDSVSPLCTIFTWKPFSSHAPFSKFYPLCSLFSHSSAPYPRSPTHPNTAHVAVQVALHPLFPPNQLFSWSHLCPSFLLSFLLLFPLSPTLSNQSNPQRSGFRVFVFEFEFNPAFYYRLAFRLLTQTWLPLLEVCRMCDPWPL